MMDQDIQYGVCHRQTKWRKVSGKAIGFFDLKSALFGPKGARNLFSGRGELAERREKYGAPLFAGAWCAETLNGVMTDGRRLYVVPAAELASIAGSPIRSKAFKERSSADREAEASLLELNLKKLADASNSFNFDETGLKDLIQSDLLNQPLNSDEPPSFSQFVRESLLPQSDRTRTDPDTAQLFTHADQAWRLPILAPIMPLLRAGQYAGDPFELKQDQDGKPVLYLKREFQDEGEQLLVQLASESPVLAAAAIDPDVYQTCLGHIVVDDVRAAFVYMVDAAIRLPGYEPLLRQAPEIIDFCYSRDGRQPFSFIVNKKSLLFYFRLPSFKMPHALSHEEIRKSFPGARQNPTGEETVRIENIEQARTLMRFVSEKA